MSHTYGGQTAQFTYNSDLSGDVDIAVKSMYGQVEILEGALPKGLFDDLTIVKVAASDLLNFVAEHVRRKRISQVEQDTGDIDKVAALEQSSAAEILGIPPWE